jgi:hypothetical protein
MSSGSRASMSSRLINGQAITGLKNNSPMISDANRQWQSFPSKPQSRDQGVRRFYNSNIGAQNSIETKEDTVTPTNKVAKFARNASPRLKKMYEGFVEAMRGGWNAINNPKVRKKLSHFFSIHGNYLISNVRSFCRIIASLFPTSFIYFCMGTWIIWANFDNVSSLGLYYYEKEKSDVNK